MDRMVLLLYIIDRNSTSSNTLLGTSIRRWCLPITSGYCCPRRSHTVLTGRIIERPPRGWPIAMTRARAGRLMRGNGTGVWLLVGSPRLCRCPRPTGPRGRWLLRRGTRAGVVVRGSVRLWDARVVVHLLLNLLSRWRGLLVVVRIVVDVLLLTAAVMRRRRC